MISVNLVSRRDSFGKNNLSMKKLTLAISLLSLVFLGACFPKKTAKTDASPTSSSTSRNSYRLMIAFISKGSGIDNAAYAKVESYVNSHPKKPAFNVNESGKEGEKKMYFGLNELTEDERYAFVDEVNKLVTGDQMVKVDSKLPFRKKKSGGLTATGGNETPALNPDIKYRLIISFISKGEGIDLAANDKIKAYIENHPKKPAYSVSTWGREGEIDYLLSLKELNEAEQSVFVKDVKKLVSKLDIVLFKENEGYVKKGR